MMEDVVLEEVQDLFKDEATRKKNGFCTCSQCHMDVACYVLNRIKPRYVISGRGLAHLQTGYQEKLQRDADLASLIHQGIEHVMGAKRPYFPHEREQEESAPKGPFFNFPHITGRLFNSVNFEPICGVKISLLESGKLVKMVDSNWQNPYMCVPPTAGIFSFWPYPRSAEVTGQQSQFELEILVDEADYEPFRHYFTVTLEARDSFLELGSGDRVYSLKDLYLNPGK